MSLSEIEFWDCSEDAEHLSWTSENEAIEMFLDQLPRDEWEEKTTVHGFVRETPNWDRCAEHALESVLEWLDGDYGDPDEATEETPTMKQAASEFVQKIKAEYEIWSCKKVTSIEVNTMEWVKEHCPHWLEDNSSAGGQREGD